MLFLGLVFRSHKLALTFIQCEGCHFHGQSGDIPTNPPVPTVCLEVQKLLLTGCFGNSEWTQKGTLYAALREWVGMTPNDI